MKKHLQIKGEILPPEYTHVKVEIVKQSHFGLEFGNRQRGGYSAFEHTRFHIIAVANQDWGRAGSYTGTPSFYVFGSKDKSTHKINKNIVPIDFWNQLVEAVNAYNEFEFAEDN